MNSIFAVIIGITIGFLLEWIVDFFLLRRKTRRLENELEEVRQEMANLEQALYTPEPELEEEMVVEEQATRTEEILNFEADQAELEQVVEVESLEEPTQETAEGSGIDEGLAIAGIAATAALLKDEQPEEPGEPSIEEEASAAFISQDILVPIEETAAETEQEADINPVPIDDTEWIFEETTPGEQVVSTELEGVKFKEDIEFVEGIGPAYGARLREIGIENPQQLIEKGATAKGREEIIRQTGIPNSLVLRWINHVDLYRVKGIGSEYAELLEAAGVDTVPELAIRNPQNLLQKIADVNAQYQRVRQLPSLGQVNDWIEQAKTLPRLVSY